MDENILSAFPTGLSEGKEKRSESVLSLQLQQVLN